MNALHCSELEHLGRQLMKAYDPIHGEEGEIETLQAAITQHRTHCPICSHHEPANMETIQTAQRLFSGRAFAECNREREKHRENAGPSEK